MGPLKLEEASLECWREREHFYLDMSLPSGPSSGRHHRHARPVGRLVCL